MIVDVNDPAEQLSAAFANDDHDTVRRMHAANTLTLELLSHMLVTLRRHVITWLCNTFAWTDAADDRLLVVEKFAFLAYCAQGQLETVQWAHEHYDVDAGYARTLDNLALVLACAGGHLSTARWLQETFHLTAADANARGGYALKSARAHNHADVVNWMVETFGLE